jgi:hypothetical protein
MVLPRDNSNNRYTDTYLFRVVNLVDMRTIAQVSHKCRPQQAAPGSAMLETCATPEEMHMLTRMVTRVQKRWRYRLEYTAYRRVIKPSPPGDEELGRGMAQQSTPTSEARLRGEAAAPTTIASVSEEKATAPTEPTEPTESTEPTTAAAPSSPVGTPFYDPVLGTMFQSTTALVLAAAAKEEEVGGEEKTDCMAEENKEENEENDSSTSLEEDGDATLVDESDESHIEDSMSEGEPVVAEWSSALRTGGVEV